MEEDKHGFPAEPRDIYLSFFLDFKGNGCQGYLIERQRSGVFEGRFMVVSTEPCPHPHSF